MMPSTDASNSSGFGYLYSFEVVKCLLGSLFVWSFRNLLTLFILSGLKMILTREDRSNIEVGKNQILGIVQCQRKYSCGLKPSMVFYCYAVRAQGYISCHSSELLYFPSFSNLAERDISLFSRTRTYCFFCVCFPLYSSPLPFVLVEI